MYKGTLYRAHLPFFYCGSHKQRCFSGQGEKKAQPIAVLSEILRTAFYLTRLTAVSRTIRVLLLIS